MKKDSEKAILEAAKQEFIQKGYAGARMQTIADRAGINKALLHYYFKSKEQLFSKILEDSVALVSSQLFPALIGPKSVIEKLSILVTNYIDTMNKNPHIPLFILNEIGNGKKSFQEKLKIRMIENKVFESFINQIFEEQKKGILKDIPPQHILLTAMSLITFPFIAKPVVSHILDIPNSRYSEMMDERKEIVISILKQFLLK
jgi:AcrR family transcriptional regulator